MTDARDPRLVTTAEIDQLLALCRSLPLPWQADDLTRELEAAGYTPRSEPVPHAFDTPWRAGGTYVYFGADERGVQTLECELTTPTDAPGEVEAFFATLVKDFGTALGKPTKRRGGTWKSAEWDLGAGQMLVRVRQSVHEVEATIESPYYADLVTRR